MLGADPKRLKLKVKDGEWRPHFPQPIFVGATIEVATKIAEAGDYLPGIEVHTQPMRFYPDSLHFSHLLGYVWTPSEKDTRRLEDDGLDVPDYVGKDGIERVYEMDLQGQRGVERFEVDTKRRPKRSVERESPLPGSRLTVGIDADVQVMAHELLKGYKGAVVALDPKTGEVIVLVSSPTYDSALFDGGISQTDFSMLNENSDRPLHDRAVNSRYAPGSTFKVVTALASVLAGKFNPNRPVYCAGFYQVGNRRMKCMGTHGAISFNRAFEKSCNTYFATIGMEAGVEKLREAALKCGLGSKTGVDMPTESAGIIPTEEWLNDRRSPLPWYPGDTVNMTIGQGYVETTPVQMATLASIVANEGRAFVPHIVKGRAEPGTLTGVELVEPEELVNIQVSSEVWGQLKRAMVSVIESGTALGARIPGVRWGGKTGSSQHRRGAKTHSWFIGFAPADDPKIAIAVLIEAAGHGGEVAAPMAKKIVERYLLREAKAASPASNAIAARSNSL
jgi:penicillin-binding protein 2